MSATARDPRHLLGLASDADLAEVERQYWELQSFLDLRQVPRSLRPWAIRQRALLDGAFAALAGDLDGLAEEPPEAEAPAADEESAESEDDEPVPDPNLPDGPPPREPPVQSTDGRPRPRSGFGQSPASARRESLLEIVTEDQGRASDPGMLARPEPAGRPGAGQTKASARPPERARPGQSKPLLPQDRVSRPRATVTVDPSRAPRLSQAWQRVALGLVLGLAILGALYVGTKGLPGVRGASVQPPAPSAEVRQQQAQLDQQRVAELKALVEKDPTNKDALFELGEMHIEAAKWQDSLDWFTKLLAVDPDNLHARMDIGTDNLNLGRTAEAKVAWEDVARRSPSDPQIHYNLGFLYANAQGSDRDVEAARREWQKVVELAPSTELARVAQSSLDTLPKAGQ